MEHRLFPERKGIPVDRGGNPFPAEREYCLNETSTRMGKTRGFLRAGVRVLFWNFSVRKRQDDRVKAIPTLKGDSSSKRTASQIEKPSEKQKAIPKTINTSISDTSGKEHFSTLLQFQQSLFLQALLSQHQQQQWNQALLANWFLIQHQHILLVNPLQQAYLHSSPQIPQATMAPMNLNIKDVTPRNVDTPSRDSSTSSGVAPAQEMPSQPLGYPGMPSYSHPMPLLNTPGAPPAFDGRDATSFIRLFDTMCENYNIPSYLRVKRVTQYCTPSKAQEIEAFPSYLARDWESLVTEIKEEWKRLDTEETMVTRAFLSEWVKRSHESIAQLKHYQRQYHRISSRLVKRGELDTYSQGRDFILGLSEDAKRFVLKQQGVIPNNSSATAGTVNYAQATEALKLYLTQEEALEQFSDRVNLTSDITRLADTLERSGLEKVEKQVRFADSQAGIGDQTVEALSKGFEALTLPLTTMVNRMGTILDRQQSASAPQRAGRDFALDANNRGSRSGSLERKPYDGPQVCFFCRDPSHRANACPGKTELLRTRRFHLDDARKLCMGGEPINGHSYPVSSRNGMSLYDSARHLLNMTPESIQAPQVKLIKVNLGDSSSEDLEPDEDFLVTANAARAEIEKGKSRSVTQPVYDTRARASKSTTDKQASYPTMKVARRGELGPMEEIVGSQGTVTADGPGLQRPATPPTHREGVSNTAPAKQLASKVPKTSLKKLLSKQGNPKGLVERMLQQSITMTWAEALSLSPDLQKIMFGSFPDMTVPQGVEVAQMRAEIEEEGEHAAEMMDRAPQGFAIAALPVAPISIKGVQVDALLDSGAEVSVITKRLMDQLCLTYTNGSKVSMSGVTGSSKKFLGVCEEVPITVGRLTHYVPCWVIDKLDEKVILGRSYFSKAQLSMSNSSDGSCNVTAHPEEPGQGAPVTWCAVRAEAKRNLTVEQLLGSGLN